MTKKPLRRHPTIPKRVSRYPRKKTKKGRVRTREKTKTTRGANTKGDRQTGRSREAKKTLIEERRKNDIVGS